MHVQILTGSVYSAGDDDREIAKYAHDHNCYVLTHDTDFCAFPIPGMIIIDNVISLLTRAPLPSAIPICPHVLMNQVLHVPDLLLQYACILMGNDFRRGTYSSLWRHQF